MIIEAGRGSREASRRRAISRSGGWRDRISNRSEEWPFGTAASNPVSHQNHLIKVRFSPLALAKCSLCWLLAPSGRVQIERAASSTSGLHTLSLSKVARLPVPPPPFAEQLRATAEVERLNTIASAAAGKTTKDAVRCSRLRQCILTWAFEGRFVDQDPTDEPASILLERIRAECASFATDKPKRRGRRKAKSPNT